MSYTLTNVQTHSKTDNDYRSDTPAGSTIVYELVATTGRSYCTSPLLDRDVVLYAVTP